MQTAPVLPLVTVDEHGNKHAFEQHSHQCGWCGRPFGEFTDRECQKGHVVERCCAECEKGLPARLLNLENNEPLDNPIALANFAKLRKP